MDKARIALGLFVVAIIGIVMLGSKNNDLKNQVADLEGQNAELSEELADTKEDFASTTNALGAVITALEEDLDETLGENREKDKQIEGTITLLESVRTNLETTEEEKEQLAEDLKAEEAKIGILTEQVSSITNVVGEINKLATTDKELLQKYSKVYFLNEHYIPENLVLIDDEFKFNKERRYWFHRDAYPHLKQMLEDIDAAEIDISVISAYRSFWTQGAIKANYTVQYGDGANTFSADQGFSEHQLGTAVDFTNGEVGATFEGFESTLAYSWLLSNAYKYGFVLSYPPNNEYYVFEPWHWRFVGVALATKLRNEGKYFYDEDQRTLSSYLTSIFDPIE